MSRTKTYFFLFFLIFWFSGLSQNFNIENGKNRFSMSFKFINGLVIIPMSINGSEPLDFILDTGSQFTLVTNINILGKTRLNTENLIKIAAYGSESETVDAILTKNNLISIGKAVARHSDIIILSDQNLDLSQRFGIPIYGIIGYEIFNDFVIKINPSTKRITFYKPEFFQRKNRVKKYEDFSIELIKKKPYVKAEAIINGKNTDLNLLIDSGNSDALWLFENREKNIGNPTSYLEDYLGYGLNGSIYGKKFRIERLTFGSFDFEEPVVSLPDSASMSAVTIRNRDGILGAEVLRRFTSIYDYQNRKLYLKKNSRIADKFNYNMVGLELIQPYSGLPYLEVVYVRENSPGEIAGLKKGDIILSVNGKKIGLMDENTVNKRSPFRQGKSIHFYNTERENQNKTGSNVTVEVENLADINYSGTVTLDGVMEIFRTAENKEIDIFFF